MKARKPRASAAPAVKTAAVPHRIVVEDLTETICRFLPDGTFTFVNEVYCRLFGKTEEELIGSRWLPVVVEEDLPMIEAKLGEITPENPVVVIENRVRDGRGRVRWMQFVNRGLFDDSGRLMEMQSVGRDITDRVKAVEKLESSQQRWRFALESSGFGMWDWDMVNNTAFFSRQWKAMLGYKDPADIAGTFDAWRELVHPDDFKNAIAAIENHAKGPQKEYSIELRMRCKDGSWKWVRSRGQVIERDKAGEPLRMTGTHVDISKRKAAEEREARSLQLMAEGAPAEDVLEAITQNVEAAYPGMVCSVMLVDASGTRLRVKTAPGLSPEVRQAIDGMGIGPDSPCCGAAAHSGMRVVCADVLTDARMEPFYKIVAKTGLRACWSEPIVSSDGKVLGTLACYRLEPHEPPQSEIQAVTKAARLATLVIEREWKEQARAESEARFRAIFEQAAVGIAMLETATGRFLSVNRRMCEINGRSAEEMLKLTFMDVTCPDDLQQDLDQMEELKAGRITSFNMEKRNLLPDGGTTWINLTVAPMWRPGEPPLRHIAVAKDISERKEAESNYQRELAYNRALVDHTGSFIVVLDAEGRFVHANSTFYSVMGYAVDDVKDRTPWEIGLMSGEEAARSRERFARLLRGEDNPPTDTRLRTKDGKWRVVELRSTSTRTKDGRADRIIVTGTDMTERNRLQQEIMRVVEQEHARIGHDLHDGVGQTMTGIVTMMEALTNELEGESRESAVRIHELLSQSVSEVRRMSHGLSPTSIKYRGLAGALQLLAETVRTNFRTPCECEADASIEIRDKDKETHLFRIAQEAVTNALRHGKPSRVIISLKPVSGSMYELRVEDDGVGIKRKKAGAPGGIGVRVMEYRANLIGGRLKISSSGRKGCAVSCQFEVFPPDQEPAKKKPKRGRAKKP